ncbi:uncharacterized protein LOC110346043 [Heterocephalus glaber]|uniref:Uncharacterized protein LOC110346043 n=1 Tax=Heterocephalus glaber TaxID=10181 RepID=A0AAX6S058_HETGA|nr:uncharacterized protein LOC110346043 [Heterocephalus glaber]
MAVKQRVPSPDLGRVLPAGVAVTVSIVTEPGGSIILHFWRFWPMSPSGHYSYCLLTNTLSCPGPELPCFHTSFLGALTSLGPWGSTRTASSTLATSAVAFSRHLLGASRAAGPGLLIQLGPRGFLGSRPPVPLSGQKGKWAEGGAASITGRFARGLGATPARGDQEVPCSRSPTARDTAPQAETAVAGTQRPKAQRLNPPPSTCHLTGGRAAPEVPPTGGGERPLGPPLASIGTSLRPGFWGLVTPEDVAVHFSQEEWRLLKWLRGTCTMM